MFPNPVIPVQILAHFLIPMIYGHPTPAYWHFGILPPANMLLTQKHSWPSNKANPGSHKPIGDPPLPNGLNRGTILYIKDH